MKGMVNSIFGLLRVISGIVHAHHSCGGKRGKLSGSCLSTIFKFASIQVSDTLIARRLRSKFWPDCAITGTSMKFGTVADHD